MSIETRIQEINDHLIDDYKVLRLAGADLTNVNKNIVNLKPTWRERLLYFMNNGTQVVWNNWTKVNGTGTTLSLNNTEEAPMSLTYKGNTSQEGTPTPSSPQQVHTVSGDNSIEVCGKNLLENKSATRTINGVEFTKNNNGSITINGTATDNIYYHFGANNTQTTFKIDTSKTYSLSIGNTTFPFKAFFRISDSVDTNTFKQCMNAYGTNTYKVENIPGTFFPSGIVSPFLFIYSGETINNFILYPQFEIGETATTYETYQGASYPVSLGVENLLNTKNYGSGSNGIGITSNEENVLQVSGTASANTNVLIEFNDITLQAGTYYFYLLRNSTTRVDISLRTTNNAQISNANFGNLFQNTLTNKSFTLDSSTVIHSINFYYPSGTVATDTYKIMICRETHTKEEFTPYGKAIELCKIGTYQDKIDKSSGKNLLNLGNVSGTNNNVVYSISNGQLVLNGACNSDRVTINLPTQQALNGTYTFSTNYIKATALKNSGGTNLFLTTSSNGVKTETINDTVSQLVIYGLTGVTFNNQVIQLQVEEGTITTPVYEPYGTDWYLKKEIGKVVLNGSENWQDRPNYNTWDRFVLQITTIPQQTVNGYSQYFKVMYSPNDELGYIFENVGTQIGCNFSVKGTTTLEQFKTWLSNNNTTLYYVLATPTYETITDTTLISQLEEAKKSYESQTNISQENNDLPFELDITALGEIA